MEKNKYEEVRANIDKELEIISYQNIEANYNDKKAYNCTLTKETVISSSQTTLAKHYENTSYVRLS